MLKLISWSCKILPSIWYIYELNIFVRDTVADITPFWKTTFAYGIPSAILLFFLLYWFAFRDLIIRQKAQEQFENEEKAFTVGTQVKRMFRTYIPLGVLGALVGALAYFYKPYIILLSIKIGILYSYFLLGEVLRIIDIGRKENKKVTDKLKEKSQS